MSQPPSKKLRTTRLRSTGCRTCRMRKIKCDEGRPTCFNCQKSRRTCLGYKQPGDYTFRDENDRLVQKFRTTGSDSGSQLLTVYTPDAFHGHHTQVPPLSPLADDNLEDGMQQAIPLWEIPGHRHGEDALVRIHEAGMLPGLSLMTPVFSTADRLRSFFFVRFVDSIWLHSQKSAWKAKIPDLMSSSPALYNAVLALSSLYMSRTGIDERAQDMTPQLYATTLSHLQRSLYKPDDALSDATLMATVLIGLYELVDKPGHSDWCTHMRGTSELLKIRGPAAAKTGFGRSLFYTARSFEVVRAILQCEETFMASEDWRPDPLVHPGDARNVMPSGFDETTDEIIDSAGVLWMLGARAANFQVKCARWKHRVLDIEDEAELRREAHDIERGLADWRSSLPASYVPQIVINQTQGSPYMMIEQYSCFQAGYQLSFASAFVLLLHRTVGKFISRSLTDMPSVVQEHASGIVRTAEFLTQGMTTGSMSVVWPLFMASICLEDDHERTWALQMLESIRDQKAWNIAQRAIFANGVIERRKLAEAQAQRQLHHHYVAQAGFAHSIPVAALPHIAYSLDNTV
ncbi:hypothetical protein PYCC9005_004573 [Savitreella phatthalungensis]